jgi:dihydrolipoamide dehydrogenase
VAYKRSRGVADRMVKGVHFLMKKNKITEINGWATFDDATSLTVANGGESTKVTFDNAIIATGATTRLLPGTSLSERVVTYEEQIVTDNLPGSIIIAGAGAIGVEFAYVMANYGVQVTIVEYLDRLVPLEDVEISAELAKAYKKLGVTVHTSTKVETIDDSGDKVKVTVSPAAGGESRVLEADKVLQAIGFAPRSKGYGLENTGVKLTDRGAIDIDGFMRTNVPGIYAIGDCTAKLMLAHNAEAMGIVAAEVIAGAETIEIDYQMVPKATYCQPQIGSFGWTEQQAKDKGYDVKVAKFPFTANGKAHGLGDASGFVKLIADAKYGEILGVHMIGPDVTELLPELTLAQKWDLTAEEVSRNVHAHPTLSETLKEVAHGISGHMINF